MADRNLLVDALVGLRDFVGDPPRWGAAVAVPAIAADPPNTLLGEKVQTLTKAMTSILCKALDGCTPEQILALPADFVPQIVGGQLVRIRSQTVYYILTRMKSACTVFLNRLRAAQA